MADTNILTEDEIVEIEARANATTEGPWEWGGADFPNCLGTKGNLTDLVCEDGSDSFVGLSSLDLEFIAHARTDIPTLCQTVRALRAETNQLKEELEVACEFCDEPSYDKAGNALTFLVCGRCWNKNMEVNRQTISTLRDELAALTRERDALRKQQGKTNDS